MKQVRLVQQRRADQATYASGSQVLEPPTPPAPMAPPEPYPNGYTDPNICPLSLLSLLFERESRKLSNTQTLAPLSVDTEITPDAMKARPVSQCSL